MKVLFFIESLRAGGKERRIVELLKGLTQHPEVKIELVLTRKEIHYQEVYNLNLPIHIIERKFLKKDPLLFFKFYRIAKNFRPDIIHVWGNMVAVYSLPAVKLLGIPLLNNQITDATPNQKPLGKDLVFKHSTRIIANTQAGLVAYNAPPEKSGVIYNGFNFNRLEKLEAPAVVRQRFNIKTPFVAAMVATFSPYKDYTTYLKAAINILQKRNDVTFLCIGDGDDGKFKAMVPQGLQKNILFLGKQDKVESIMNACDLGVLMTPTHCSNSWRWASLCSQRTLEAPPSW
jgi:glycosyltransferase involved in cell wall biosynthesis